MTYCEFFGCAFIAFGPPVAMFVFTIAKDPMKVIIMMASAFFWLLALLFSAALWAAVYPLKETLAFGLVFAVLFQELFRFVIYYILRKAEEGLAKVAVGQDKISIANNKHVLGYVAGLGFGVASGAFSLVNVLADSIGPGTVGIKGDPSDFFVTSALLTLAFVLLHVFWSVVFFHCCDRRGVYGVLGIIAVVLSHGLVSCLTLLNQGKEPNYVASILPAYAVCVAFGVWAYKLAGGSCKSIGRFLNCHRR